MPKKKTTAEFIADARKVHGDKYDYSKVVYEGVYKKVCIICPKHGEFLQTPDAHSNNQQGCPKCGIELYSERLRKSPEEFYRIAREVHGNRYDYSQVQYVDRSTPVCIVCAEHGPFLQAPDSHMKGAGCPVCAKDYRASLLRKTKEQFVEEARAVHGDKYDYSETDWVDSRTVIYVKCPIHGPFHLLPFDHLHGAGCAKCNRAKEFYETVANLYGDTLDFSKAQYFDLETHITVICPVHGELQLRPHALTRGRGCPKCGKVRGGLKNRVTLEEFLRDAHEKHGDKYDYSLVDIQGIDTPVRIICPEHGEFLQTPYSHARNGAECPACVAAKAGDARRKTQEQFLKEAHAVHGDRYDYSLVEYKNTMTNVRIICPVHGEFLQTPLNHLSGAGCMLCYHDRARNDVDELIQQFNEVHHNKYDYSKVVYKNIKTRITVICPEHGDFTVRPDQHRKGQECPICTLLSNESKMERRMREFLEANGFLFVQEHPFPWLRSQNPMFLDFYLPEYNIAIECQGEQHFKPFKYYGGKKGFAELVARDILKQQQCSEHGINILYYSNLHINFPYDVITQEKALLNRINDTGKIDKPIWMPDAELPLEF